jgi:hypothetical protein
MDHLLVASLGAAFVVYLYDLFFAGPAWARTLLPVAALAFYDWPLPLESALDGVRLATITLGAAFLGLAWVALVQLLQVQRDAAMTQVLRRR